MTRDTLADADYFTALIAEEERYIAEDHANIDENIRTRGSKASGMASRLVADQLICVDAAYSRGDALEDVQERVTTALADLKYLRRLYDLNPTGMRRNRGSYLNKFRRATYALAFQAGDEAKSAVLSDIGFFGTGEDPILDAMVAGLSQEPLDRRRDPAALLYPEKYAELWEAIFLGPDGGERPLGQYLEGWYSANENTNGSGTLGIGAHRKMIRYRGYWCWEVAAVVVWRGIDDSAFRDHPHYPVDLANWAKSRI